MFSFSGFPARSFLRFYLRIIHIIKKTGRKVKSFFRFFLNISRSVSEILTNDVHHEFHDVRRERHVAKHAAKDIEQSDETANDQAHARRNQTAVRNDAAQRSTQPLRASVCPQATTEITVVIRKISQGEIDDHKPQQDRADRKDERAAEVEQNKSQYDRYERPTAAIFIE